MAQPKAFVSHSHVDDAFAEQLVYDLRMAGADAWLDKTDLGAGDFQTGIGAALERCEWFVLVLTKSAIESPWVTQEVHAANRLKHQMRIRDLILIKAGPVEQHEIPAMWGVYNVFDATNDYDLALAKTLKALGNIATISEVAYTPNSGWFDLSRLIHRDKANRHQVAFGRPNRRDDGPALTLDAALNTSVAHVAYTRVELIPGDPRERRKEPRIIAVEQTPTGKWQAWEFPLNEMGWQGWPMVDFQDAEAYCAYKLDVPGGAVWYPATAPIEVEYADGLSRGMF